MNVLDIFGHRRDIREIAAGTVLAALRFTGRSTGIHQKQRIFCEHLLGFHPGAVIFFQFLVDDYIPAFNEWRVRGVFPGITLPDQQHIDLLAAIFSKLTGIVIHCFVVEQLARPVVSVHGNQHSAVGVDNTIRTGA